MAVTAIIPERSRPLSVVDYSITENATPLAPGDSSGGVGTVNVTVQSVDLGPLNKRTAGLVDQDLTVVDNDTVEFTPFRGRGAVVGHTTSITELNGVSRIAADTILSRLNTDRDAEPFYGVRKTAPLITYVTNLITNPSAETAATGYTAVPGTGGAATVARSNASGAAQSGSWYMRQAWTTGATAAGGISYLQNPVTAGAVYNASGWVNSVSKNQTMRLTLQWETSGGVPILTTLGSPVIVAANTWTRLSVLDAAPAGAAQLTMRFEAATGAEGYSNWANGNVLLLDSVQLTLGQTLYDYFDGSSANSSWQGTANASASTQTFTTPQDVGYDATVGNAFRYYCELVGIQSSSVLVDSEFEYVNVAFPAWSGNVWTYVKMLCAAYAAEIVVQGSTIRLRTPRLRTVPSSNSFFQRTVSAAGTAQNIDIYNYNLRWGTDQVAFTATDTYSLNSEQTQVIYVKVDHDLGEVNSPTPVRDMDNLYPGGGGQYAILDSNNIVINPAWWTSRGGKVIASMDTSTARRIKITMIAPREDDTYVAPFRIGQPALLGTTEAFPALVITGSGVFQNRETVRLGTGASERQTSTTVASVIDNPFIGNINQAVSRGMAAVLRAGGPLISIRGRISFDRGASSQEFGSFIGSRIFYDRAYYRITEAAFTRTAIEFSGIMDTTFGDSTAALSVTFDEVNATAAGFTFDNYNTLYTGMTFAQVQATVPQPTFDQVNAIYDGMTFNDHAVWPLATKLEGAVEG